MAQEIPARPALGGQGKYSRSSKAPTVTGRGLAARRTEALQVYEVMGAGGIRTCNLA